MKMVDIESLMARVNDNEAKMSNICESISNLTASVNETKAVQSTTRRQKCQ